jgi:hypothetical protein
MTKTTKKKASTKVASATRTSTGCSPSPYDLAAKTRRAAWRKALVVVDRISPNPREGVDEFKGANVTTLDRLIAALRQSVWDGRESEYRISVFSDHNQIIFRTRVRIAGAVAKEPEPREPLSVVAMLISLEAEPPAPEREATSLEDSSVQAMFRGHTGVEHVLVVPLAMARQLVLRTRYRITFQPMLPPLRG